MVNKMTWEKMKDAYPDEWLMISEIDRDEHGTLKAGIVERHSREKEEVYRRPSLDKSTAFRFTGESTFSGLRSHAQNVNPVWYSKTSHIHRV